ncbi:MAG: DUF1778 domain-containing protein [Bacteroidales bacterium]|nr:DUF1778 domain-containing protein [Bacteroidales bacterium]MCF8343128.1 DUF1778 domain-containing protein [Bacteroidales bacterium]MCF8351266.1 DUF1778 domain-containing protein [Bacteroidales bacterium]MCF8376096.1 DUF1778 domain-containing protein [Bacteroidales bacterium]MCF8400371.1 DUF1778 domain-containing protein [Bacteroidales bacterium]
METNKSARFDTRWTTEQKELFEYASRLGGYRTLSEFVFVTVREKAEKIIEDNNNIIKTKEDQELFFDCLMNPPEPNENLIQARSRYNEIFGV